MTDINRRNMLKFALLAPIAAGMAGIVNAQTAASTPNHVMPDMGPELNKVHWLGDEQIGMLMYPGMTIMDLIGPQCMFGSMMGAKIHLVAKTLDPVTSDAGVTIVPTATFETCPRDLTVLANFAQPPKM